MRCLPVFLVAAAWSSQGLMAAEPINNEYFEKKVRPILAAKCIGCHGPKKQKGGLRLDSREALLRGGDIGPAAQPGNPEKSLLIKAIRFTDSELQMPQKGKMSDEEIGILTSWVKGGIPWPNSSTAVQAAPGKKFDLQGRARALWSFQPIANPSIPRALSPATRTPIPNPIDAFLLAKLRAAGLEFSPRAEKRALLRRATFDLTGLPPTPVEIEAFLKDVSPNAFEKVVDRLLASPRYGERWGRHWLDLVRYAETFGHEFDFDIPDAWRYRDYVVRAFNADVPYNHFLTEHIAGDLLAKPRLHPKTGANESIVGTGFWWFGEAKHSPVDSRIDYADRIDNQIDVFGKAVLGLTLACARCHDHKFDPIAAKDYYSLFSILASSRFQKADITNPAEAVKLLDEIAELKESLSGKIAAKVDGDLSAKTVALASSNAPPEKWREKAAPFESFEGDWRGRWDAAGLALRKGAAGIPHSGRESRKLAGALRSPTFIIEKPFLSVRMAGRDARVRLVLNGLQLIRSPIYGGLAHTVNHGEEFRWVNFNLSMWKGQPAYLEVLDEGPGYFAIEEVCFTDAAPPQGPSRKAPLWSPGAKDDKRIVQRILELEAKLPTTHRAPAARDGTGRNEHVFIRGNPKTLGIEAPRAFLAAFGKPDFTGAGSGRLQLAQAVTDPANPLVTRVLVNRLWEHHFGEGIVRSPDNFGNQGQQPTHPELLDWLATEFVKRGWSIKAMHKMMLLSAAYQQASRATPEQAAKAVTADPQNKLLHKQNVQRLEAEAIRDSMLAASGRLDTRMEGPGVLPFLTEHQVGRGRPASGPLDGNGRRSIYLQVRRNFINPMFTAFDYPTPFTTIGRRSVSNVPAQALAMLNNPFVLQQADLWAKRVLASPGSSEARIRRMYSTAFGRLPTPDELALAREFVGRGDQPKRWADLAHVLFNSKEFIFIE